MASLCLQKIGSPRSTTAQRCIGCLALENEHATAVDEISPETSHKTAWSRSAVARR